MYVFQEKEGLVFVKEISKNINVCIRTNIVQDKFLKLLPIYIGRKLVFSLLGLSTFDKEVYLFKDKDNNFKLIQLDKDLFQLTYKNKNKSLSDYELLFSEDIDLIFKAIKKFSKQAESIHCLLTYNGLFEEIIERLEKVM